MTGKPITVCCISTLLLVSLQSVCADESRPNSAKVSADNGSNRPIPKQHLDFFESRIRPVLVKRCYECHSADADELQGGLFLDSRAGITQGGESGPLLDMDTPEASLLLQALRHEDLEMPPDRKLPEPVIADFEQWVKLGAPDPRTKGIPSSANRIDWQQARKFWSFRRPVRPPLPFVEGRHQVSNAIDLFILKELEAKGITLNPMADRRTLIRRVFFDLIGLPPSPAEVEAFLADSRPDAYEHLVERLLSSPHYGERWGRHWLDVAGYAESNGIIADGLTPHAWRYRDYVIRALNKDKPYDRFLLEQFAGDELFDWRNSEVLTEEIEESLTATGFLRCTPDGTDTQDIFQLEKRWDHLQATVEVAMKASVGLVLNCARCHDHKFDPVLQEDYYSLVGLFLPAYDPDNWLPCTDARKSNWPVRYILKAGKTERNTAARTLQKWGTVIKSLNSDNRSLATEFHDRWLVAQATQGKLPLTLDEIRILKLPAEKRTVEGNRISANLRSKHQAEPEELRSLFPEFERRADEIERKIAEARQSFDHADRDRIWALWDVSPSPPHSRLLVRGDFMSPGRVVPTGIPRIFDDPENPFVLPEPGSETTGYRLALARWLTGAAHPLTARVMVNRLWQYHFGRGIVATPDDFGFQGSRPTHPELLDWLAVEFIQSGWSIKAMHRLILSSSVYRQSSQTDPQKVIRDSDNQLLSRRTPRRLEAEAIRDAMLSVAENLDGRFFGPAIPLEQLDDGQYIVASDNAGRLRRSVYIRVRRTTPVSFLETFDSPQVDTNVPRRFSSNVPLQSLSLLNNPFVVECAKDFANRLFASEPDDETKRIVLAFEIAYSRSPSPDELDSSRGFFAGDSSRSAWELFCHGLIASNEFLYVN